MEPVLYAGAFAGVVALAGVGTVFVVDQPVQDRFQDIDDARRARRGRRRNPVASVMDALGTPLARPVLNLVGTQRIATWERLLDAAGRPGGTTVRHLAARKASYGIVLGLVGLVTASAWWMPIALGLFGFFLPELSLRSQAKERQDEISRALPDFLDVLSVTVSAGLDFRSALTRVADAFDGPLSDEIRTALQQMMLGTPRREALHALRARNSSEPLSEFVTALQQAEELGAPLTSALAGIAGDVRKAYGQQARREAAKVEPRLSVVMTITLIPAAMITIGVGFYLSSGVDFGAMFGG
ncbi:MAG TPA: type II secretion system F family protein [Egicoccus sp.]|nr:type II secretion system F family protein [Egicoccus sp.]HSK22822.1 type II secretion system F family protein [Egicoccus sp.]